MINSKNEAIRDTEKYF